MGRTSNDDRSDSMNPNNSAYEASEDNRLSQIRAGDDDDDDDDPVPATAPRSWICVNEAGRALAHARRDAPEPPPVLVFDAPPVSIRNVRFAYLRVDGKREETITVDSPSIDAAVAEARVLWEGGGIAFMALYDDGAMYLEELRPAMFPLACAREVASLGDVQGFLELAEGNFAAERNALGKHAGQGGTHYALTSIQRLGAWHGACEALRREIGETRARLAAQGEAITADTQADAIAAARLDIKAVECRDRVRAAQQGKSRNSIAAYMFRGAEKIRDIRP